MNRNRTLACLATIAVMSGLCCLFCAIPAHGQTDPPQTLQLQLNEPGQEPVAEPAPEPAPPVPDIVAKVGEETITRDEYLHEVELVEQQMADQFGGQAALGNEQRFAIVEDMINAKVLHGLARKSDVKVTPEEAQAFIDEEKKKLPSEEEFTKYLERMKFTEEKLRDLVMDNMLIERFVDQATKDLAVSAEELQSDYDRMKEAGHLDRPEETRDVSHVLIRVEGEEESAWDEGKKKIDAAHARVKSGESFEAVAKEVSEDPGSAPRGGAYKEVPKGQMVPEFDELTFKLGVGELSEPFRTQFGWHFLTVTGTHPAGTMTLDEVKEPMEGMILKRKRQETVRNMVAEARKAMNVEVMYPPKEEGGATETAAPAAAPAASK